MRERDARADDADAERSGVNLTFIDEMLRLTSSERRRYLNDLERAQRHRWARKVATPKRAASVDRHTSH